MCVVVVVVVVAAAAVVVVVVVNRYQHLLVGVLVVDLSQLGEILETNLPYSCSGSNHCPLSSFHSFRQLDQ